MLLFCLFLFFSWLRPPVMGRISKYAAWCRRLPKNRNEVLVTTTKQQTPGLASVCSTMRSREEPCEFRDLRRYGRNPRLPQKKWNVWSRPNRSPILTCWMTPP
uniref:Putative secreted protein n=1 Tax=Ixodes ricinus TaxID=34613 RepID=A0A6B0UHL6_IXORI